MREIKKVLVFGFGNPGRLDDGLGPAFAEMLEEKEIPGVTVDSNYQLSVEDSNTAAEHDMVIFVDASVNCKEPYSFDRIYPGDSMSFTTHSVEPEAVLALAKDLFKAEPTAYMLGIRGYEFNEFGQKLSDKAKSNLVESLDFLTSFLLESNSD